MEETKKQHILAMGLRLSDSIGFEVVGEKGAENFQFLFSTFKRMIKNDHQCQLVDNQSKEAVLQSLYHTIAFYSTTNVKEVQNLLENLENNVDESFMIIPVYKVSKFVHDHVHCLLIHKINDQYVVTKMDKLHNFTVSGEVYKYANFYTKISKNKLPALSQILFLSKQEYRKESILNIADIINTLNKCKRTNLPVDWSGYRGVADCPINEPLATLRLALYNCRHNIFTDRTNRYKPKVENSKEFHKHFFQAFNENKKEVKPYYQALWQIYEERKDKAHCEKLWQEHCQEKKANGEKYIKKDKETMDRFLANHFVNKVLALPDTPEFIKHTKNLRAKGEAGFFKVFTSDSGKLKKWDSEKCIKHVSNTNRTKQLKRRFRELLPGVSKSKSIPTTQKQFEGPSR
ncbi:MAG: hypothetical protein IC227_09840 [Enterococcus lacertideformus]|uniref:Uncharacterized protein n=1 Tax=Enterococcus lacertideformus TaxID=2771493 RepID=A0A931FCA0_9ENTE|nr:hypothetical protein [Enterococcus lacertideformus]